MDQYCVFGNPIAHSKSPLIHQAFAKQTEQTLQYHALLVPVDGFADAATQFFAQQGRGCNVTVPFKLDAFKFADELSERAQCAGAVNTLTRQPSGKILGDNTDGFGLVADLLSQNVVLKNRKVLILGAGGAVRGVLQPLFAEQPELIHIANRTESKATQLAHSFQDLGSVSGSGWEHIPKQTYDVVINGTAASLQGDVPPIESSCLKASSVCYDMMYSAKETAFLQWAKDQGIQQRIDGLGMLVAQAAESFRLWHGVTPNWQPILQQIRQEIRR